jgi:hypothetical protein
MNYDDMIDEDFLSLLESRVQDAKSINKNKFKKQLETLMRVGFYIDDLKPKSKYRSYKKDIIGFVDYVNYHPDMDNDEYSRITQEKLSDIIIFLQSNHSFMFKNDWFWAGIFNFAFDLLLFILGLGKYYYYVPVFTIISIIRNIKRIKKAEKSGKILEF